MKQRVVRKLAVGADPKTLNRRARFVLHPGQLADVALIDRMGLCEPFRELASHRFKTLEQSGQRSRGPAHRASGTGGRMHLPRRPGTRPPVEDGATVLYRDDATGRERTAVTDAVDLVEDRHRGSPGRKK